MKCANKEILGVSRMNSTPPVKEKWTASLLKVTFMGRKKISEEIVKENLTKKDLEIIELLKGKND